MKEEIFNALPQAVQDWIKEIGWKVEDIDHFSLENEILPDGSEEADGINWKRWKRGKRVDVTIWKEQEMMQQSFNRLSKLEWERA